MSDGLLVALSTAVVGAFSGIGAAVLTRKPTRTVHADYADSLIGSSVALVQELQEEMARLKVEVHECETRYGRLVKALRSQGLDIPPEATLPIHDSD